MRETEQRRPMRPHGPHGGPPGMPGEKAKNFRILPKLSRMLFAKILKRSTFYRLQFSPKQRKKLMR